VNEFAALTGEVNTLAGMPNHPFVHPRILTRADGTKTMRAKELAWGVIKQLATELTAAATDSERVDVAEEQENVEVLLAFLRGLLSPVTLRNMEGSPHLNQQHKLILNKVRTPVKPQAGTSLDSALGLAVATHSLMISMQKAETTRLQDRADDKSAKSLMQNLLPRQQALFTKLCTNNMRKAAVMPPFMVSTNLIHQASRKWKGAFSKSGLARFLAGGCLSQEGN
jgi:hypothetical protein